MIVSVDTSGFRAMTRELAKISGKTHREAIRYEAGRVLDLCVKRTGAAKKGAYPRQGTQKAGETGSKLTINAGVRGPAELKGRVWLSELSDKGGYTHYIIRGPYGARPGGRGSGPMRWSNQRWARAMGLLAIAEGQNAANKASRSKKRKDKLTGRGLAKQSWAQIADRLGINLGVPALVRNAIPQDGQARKSGKGEEKTMGDNFFLELTNWYPLIQSGKGRGNFDGTKILAGAVSTRVKAFANALRFSVFKDIKGRAQKYPGLFSVS